MNIGRKRRLALTIIEISITLIWTLLPWYFLVVVSLSPPLGKSTSVGLFKSVTLDNYKKVIGGYRPIWPSLIDSTVVSSITTIIILVLAAPCAYSLSRLKTRSSNFIYLTFFVMRMIPSIALALPYYIIFAKLRLLDSYPTLIIANIPINLSLAVWLLKGFCDAIPEELEEAAKIDGASFIQTFTKIITPILAQGALVTAINVFLMTYIDFIYAISLTAKEVVTFPIYIQGFKSEFIIHIEEMAAASVIGTLPMIFLYLLCQRNISRMVLSGSLK